MCLQPAARIRSRQLAVLDLNVVALVICGRDGLRERSGNLASVRASTGDRRPTPGYSQNYPNAGRQVLLRRSASASLNVHG